jgi:Type II secretion system (T2SS), protein E, N-terminal domain
MPVLMKRLASRENLPAATGEASGNDEIARGSFSFSDGIKIGSALLRQCGNAECRSGWMKLWRSRQSPVLEGKWACSAACMQAMVQAAIRREAVEADNSSSQRVVHQHRVPLGLMLLSRGGVVQEQLRRALDAQRKAGTGKLGEWLIRQGATNEEQVARALSAQWNCPVLSGIPHNPVTMASTIPRLLMDSFGIVPLRIAGRELLYVAFEDRIDRSLVLAVERMLGLKVEAGVLRDSEFRRMQQDALRASFPKTRLLEAANMRGVVHAVTSMIEERKAARSQIVRIRDYYWLRIWRNPAGNGNRRTLPENEDIEDMVCSLVR